MKNADYEVYMHGQILETHSFYLRDGFLEPDEYSELKAKYFLPGGETGTAATVLASLGVKVKIDGRGLLGLWVLFGLALVLQIYVLVQFG